MGVYFLEYNNFLPADPLKTPPHIAPVWYFTPFYSMLRATTADFTWVLVAGSVFAAIALFLKGNLKGFMRIAVPVVLLLVAVLLRTIDAKFWGVVAMGGSVRSEEHTSELQALMRTSYAVRCLKKKHTRNRTHALDLN